MKAKPDIQTRILDLLAARPDDGVRPTDLRRRLGVRGRAQLLEFRQAIRTLETEGRLATRRRGRLNLPGQRGLVAGRITVHPHGFAFVKPDDGSPDIHIAAHATNLAVSGDRVLVARGHETDERGPSGTVHSILERGRTEVTGEYVEDGDDAYVRPLRRDYPERLPVCDRTCSEGGPAPEHGDWVVARLERPRWPTDPLQASLLRRLAKGNTVDGDLDAVISEYGLLPRYSEEEDAAAARLEPRPCPREPMESTVVVTIDPEDAKDYDDGLSAEPGAQPGTIEVGVHIADVAAYVTPGAAADAGARERGFTAYLPGRTLPMLPASLASDRCSLLADEARMAHSILLTLDTASGEVVATRRAHTLIRCRRRLTFQEVQEFLGGSTPGDWPEAILPTLERLRAVYVLMRRRRAAQEEFLDLATAETRVRCTERPARILGIVREPPNAAHALVEEFMLAANTAVAQEFVRAGLPGVFRVHAEPKATDLAEFREWNQRTLGLSPGRLDSRQAVNRFLAGLAPVPSRELVLNAFLRALPRAGYSAAVQPHYGLGKEQYAHFTSPIRRYPDLLVHQQLWAADHAEDTRSLGECEGLARRCTDAEAAVDEAYYAANDRLKLRYVRGLLEGRERVFFEGIVARFLRQDVLVYIPDLGIYGVLAARPTAARPLRGGARRGPQTRELQPGKTLRCGDFTYVRVRRIDVVKGVFELQPMEGRSDGA